MEEITTVEQWLGEHNKIGIDIWNNKYRDEDETFNQWLIRVSNGDADVEQLILEKKFLFGGRTLANYNTYKPNSSTSNCYSSGYAPDDLKGLMQLAQDIALTYKSQGGQGVSLSKIRPKGCKLSNGFTTDGIEPFMQIFNTVTQSVSQGGSRKGALMMSLDVWHKEAETFIKIKSQEGKIEGANLSLEIDDEFMEIVKCDLETNEETKVERTFLYDGGYIIYDVVPVKLFKLMCTTCWDWAEPGVIFTNRFRNYNLMENVEGYDIVTGNPCGEQPLPKDGACNLGSINLSEFVKNPYTEDAEFDFELFKDAVHVAIRALDDVIDYGINYHALPSQKEMAQNYRNIGLGVMGLGSCLFKMGLTYGDEDSIKFIDYVMWVMFRSAVKASNQLAKIRGHFPKYHKNVLHSEIMKNHFDDDEIKQLEEHGLRNCSLLSIAPSGSIGTMLNITTGAEPAFAIKYNRTTKSLVGQEKTYEVKIDELKEYQQINNTEEIPSFFITSNEIHYIPRLKVQATLQQHIDTAISSTVNLPNDVTVAQVMELYIKAWEYGLKGVTIYRDGCKRYPILSQDDNNSEEELTWGDVKPVSGDTIYYPKTLYIGCGKIKLMIGFSPSQNSIQDIYTIRTGTGGCEKNLQHVAIAVSHCLRAGIDISNLENAFSGVGACNSFVNKRAKGGKISTGINCGSAILNTVKEFISNEDYISKDSVQSNDTTSIKCPSCGKELTSSETFVEGCMTCPHCGYSKC